jgi:hypothetical protein
MSASLLYGILADAVLIIHFLFVLFLIAVCWFQVRPDRF